MNDTVYTLHRGRTPLVVSVPHAGTEIAPELRERVVERALGVEDTDWYLDRLYAFAKDLGASLLLPRYSRYVVDLNRPPDNQPMYAGANNTELTPTRFFTGDALYRDGHAPDDAEVQRRVAAYWRPYHDALAAEVARLRERHGHAVVFDAHSIKSVLPWLFEGTLPHMNLGTAAGTSCDAGLERRVVAVFDAQRDYSYVLNGRFKGGHITRHYGQPDRAFHAVQLELAQRTYMNEAPPFDYRPDVAEKVQPVLQRLVQTMIEWRP